MDKTTYRQRDPSLAARAFARAAMLVVCALFPIFPFAAAAQEAPQAPQEQSLPKGALPADAAAASSPLAPIAEQSPRQTFMSFHRLLTRAEDSLLTAIRLTGENDAIFDTPEVDALKQQAINSINRATSTLDLSQVPPANRRTVGLSSVLLLNEIFDRIPLPDPESIPDTGMIGDGTAIRGWTVPGTEIRMVRIDRANGEPRFVFSSDTVRRLPEFYARVKYLPGRTNGDLDFYQSFVLGPGLSMPLELYRYVLNMPTWMLDDYYEQAVWQWLGFAVLTLVTLGVVFLLLRWEMHRPTTTNAVGRSFRHIVAPLLIIALLSGYRWINDNLINLTGDVLAGLELVVLVFQAIAIAAVIIMAFNAVATLIIAMPHLRKESLDASLIRLALRVIGILVAGYVLALTAAKIGIPLYGIIASLGVGGLALALAVRPTLENFIGGIILYADRPVRVGDFCKFGSMLGTVEAIGLRSTKVRGLDRTLITVQNAEFSQMSITNFTRRDSNLMQATIALRYETPDDKLSEVVEAIDTMLRSDDRVKTETVRVCLRGLGSYSLNIEIWGYVKSADWTQFLKIQEDLFKQVIGIVRERGCLFAFPTQTTYLGADPFIDGDAGDLRRRIATETLVTGTAAEATSGNTAPGTN